MSATALMDPRGLTSQQKRAFLTIADRRLYRRAGGWGRGDSGVTLAMVEALTALGLVRIERGHTEPHPVLTGAGQMLLAVIQQRAERRRA